MVKPLNQLPKLRFEEAPAGDIFKALEDAYGVQIAFAEGAMVNCPLTTTLTDQTLFEKLDIICHPLGLVYYEQDARIVINGHCR